MLLLMLVMQIDRFQKFTFTAEAGTRDYWVYVPTSYRPGSHAALIVMLHGCTQDAGDIARGTRLNERAEQEGFIVLYPEQPETMNPKKCWNWYDTNNQQRDRGEPALIHGMTRDVMAKYAVGRHRVYLAGISAGAAMATLVAVAYPETYNAIALHSGMEYRAADNVMEALAAMKDGGPDPRAQGAAALTAMGARAKVIPVLIVHGSKDTVVPPLHAAQLLVQWLVVNGAMDAPRDESSHVLEDGYRYTRAQYTNRDGRVVVESIVVAELGHAWSGGSAEGTYTDAKGPNATDEMIRFFRSASGK